MTEADEKTVNEMIGYFMPCWHNAAQGSEAKKRFARYIDTLTRMGQEESGWISVKDRLPDGTKGQVLALVMRDDGGWFRMLAWYSKKYGWFSDDPDFDNGRTVTHWMPVPDYPEVEAAERPKHK